MYFQWRAFTNPHSQWFWRLTLHQGNGMIIILCKITTKDEVTISWILYRANLGVLVLLASWKLLGKTSSLGKTWVIKPLWYLKLFFFSETVTFLHFYRSSITGDFCGDGRCDDGTEDIHACPMDCCPNDNPDKCQVVNNTCPDECCGQPLCCREAPIDIPFNIFSNMFILTVIGIGGFIVLLNICCCCCCALCSFKCRRKRKPTSTVV